MAVSSGGGVADAPLPTLPGQDALEADPNTDWSKINLTALREHLIDMNEMTLHAAAQEQRLDDGLDVIVTGEGRTLDAIRRMLPAHASELNHLNGWRAGTETLLNGVRLVITSDVPMRLCTSRASVSSASWQVATITSCTTSRWPKASSTRRWSGLRLSGAGLDFRLLTTGIGCRCVCKSPAGSADDKAERRLAVWPFRGRRATA